MNRIVTLALKDLRVLSRDWFALFWIAIFPLVFALFFGAIFPAQGRGANAMPVAIIDEENTAASRAFVERLKKSPALAVETKTREEAHDEVRRGKLVAYLVVKSGFNNPGGFFGGPPRTLELGIDPKRQAEVGFLKGLLMESAFADLKDLFTDPGKARAQMDLMLAQLDKDAGVPKLVTDALRPFLNDLKVLLAKLPKQEGTQGAREMIKLEEHTVTRQQVRPLSGFEVSFPSSILWGIIGCVAAFSMSIVIERVQGTFLRLRTAPLTQNQLLAGKGLACFLSCIAVVVFLLALAATVLQVRLGNPLLLALATVCIAMCFTGLMMFVSTLGKTEAGVAGAAWGIMMPLAMIGGGMVPLMVMPGWMQTVSHVSPVKWGIVALEGAIWRDFGLADMLLPCVILVGVGAVLYALGVWSLSRQQT